jgi:death-on-curing protein
MDVTYLLMQEVLYIHYESLRRYGGAPGIRDQAAIQGALARPQFSVFGSNPYSTKYLKAAAYLDSFSRNHPFVDGNKRVAYVSAGLFLSKNGILLAARASEAYEFVIDVVCSSPTVEYIAEWIELHCTEAGP